MTEILRPRRPLSLAAIALFFIAYAAVIILMLAPKDMFSAIPGSLITQDE
ncbi:MAG: hypothetical protein IPL38_07055 [Rhodobacter sp.]|jgi:hypothetical protein|nr:hypothetical protein [Rhodobacter sp.]MBK8439271.1 hypothetical protein [Rhodobacter sp.]